MYYCYSKVKSFVIQNKKKLSVGAKLLSNKKKHIRQSYRIKERPSNTQKKTTFKAKINRCTKNTDFL